MSKFSLLMFIAVFSFATSTRAQAAPPTVHTYFIAADEIDWNYTPFGVDPMMGMDFTCTAFRRRDCRSFGREVRAEKTGNLRRQIVASDGLNREKASARVAKKASTAQASPAPAGPVAEAKAEVSDEEPQ